MTQDYERWIEAYLDGELSAEEQLLLEAWLRADRENVRIFVRATHADNATREAVTAGLAKAGAGCPTCPEPGSARPWWRGRFAAMAAAILLLNAGGLLWIRYEVTRTPLPTVRVLTVTPAAEADQADRFTLRFDRDLVSAELMGKVEPAGLFELSPGWPGKWQWAATDTLEYVLAKPLPPGRRFRLHATETIATRAGRKLEGAANFEVVTRALALTEAKLTASDNQTATVELTFNQPVDPGDLLRGLQARDDKDDSRLPEPVLLTKKADEKMVVQVSRPPSGRLRIVLDKDLAGAKAERPLGQTVVRQLEVAAKFALMNAGASGPDLEGPAHVVLQFNHPLKADQAVQVTSEPAVEGMTVTISGASIRVRGGFEPGKGYVLSVPATLLDAEGRPLPEKQTARVQVPPAEPTVAFAHRHGVLSPAGNLELDMTLMNVKALEVYSRRIHDNNLVMHLRRRHDPEVSREGAHKTVKLDLPPNRPNKAVVSLRGLVEGNRGIYQVFAQVPNRWDSDSAYVTVTDLALTAKRQRTGYVVWVTSLRTAQPEAGATVKAISRSNQTLATARTDRDGLARLAVSAEHPDGACWVLTAEKGDDLTYLVPEENEWMVDSVAQSGRAYPTSYEVLTYTDRGVYRPGEEIYLTGVIRDLRGAVPPAFPLSVKVIRPDGRQVADLPVTPAEGGQGMFHVTYPTAADSQTGPYRFQVALPGAKESIGDCHAQVEAFLPVRMEVKAVTSAKQYGPGDKPSLSVSGRYLWNQPAAGQSLTVVPVFNTKRFSSPAHADWRFGASEKPRVVSPEAIKGVLDAKGLAAVPVPVPEDLPRGLYRLNLSATVTDAGGRSVSANTAADVDTLGVHIGLQAPGGEMPAVGQAVPVRWVRLKASGEPGDPGEMKMRFVRVEYDSVLKRVGRGRSGYSMVWQSVERLFDVKTEKVAAGGASGQLEVTCPDGGYYRLYLSDVKTGSVTTLDFYTAGGESVSMEKPERLEIVADQAKYAAGSTAKVLVRSPVPGTLLLTLETDRVVGHYLGQVKERTASMLVPIPAGVRGGAFLTATVIRPVDPGTKSWLPHRAMGMTRVLIDHQAGELPLTVTAPKQARPEQAVTVSVETGPPGDPARPTMVHLWAVDEGILLAAGYAAPDPRGFFFSPRALGVSTADIFFRLLPDFARPAGIARIGGDGDDRRHDVGDLRRSPVPARQRKPAVIWRTAVPVDAEGKLSVELKLPDRIGQMRIMAVAADADRYARAEQALTVTSPLIAEATWPRFAAPGDSFQVPVKLFNSQAAPMTVRVRPVITGPLEVAADPKLEAVVVRPGEPVTLLLKVKAVGIGGAEAEVLAEQTGVEGPAERASSKASLSVRPAGGLHTDVQLVAVPAGKPRTLAMPDTFAAGSPVRTRVRISARPSVQLSAALEQLIGYPYGCVEQTSSRLMGLLYAPDVLGDSRGVAVQQMIDAGIARLWSMQTVSGGLAYWPGGSQADAWGTAYAASVLMEAKAAGHKIDPRFVAPLVKYMQAVLAGEAKDTDANTKALVCRVLATYGKAPEGWMARLAEQKDSLDLAARVHLGAAFAAVGRKDRAAAVLPDQPLPVLTTTGGRLVSPVRAEGLWLLLLLENDPASPMVPHLAARLDKARPGTAWWGSTLENATAVAALSRYQVATAGKEKPDFKGQLWIGAEPPVKFDHTKAFEALSQAGGSVIINPEGTGTAYAVVSREGLAAEGVVKPYDKQLIVRRRWLDAAGKAVDPKALKVGDLVTVRVSIRRPGGPWVQNVAIVDALPGAMEVENPRLATSARAGQKTPGPEDEAADGEPDEAAPVTVGAHVDVADHVEFLDDRVVLFCGVGEAPRVFQYALRVTTAGEFALPPIQASCMYDPATASLGEPGRVKVEK